MCVFNDVLTQGKILIGLLLAILLPVGAMADQFHYVNLLIGERAAGMGGAYTAISDTPDGAYYNPAGIAFIQGNSLSASVNAYNYSLKTYKDALTLASGSGVDYERESSVLLPNFFGMVSSLGQGKIGFSYAVPDSIQREQDQMFTDLRSTIGIGIKRYTLNLNEMDNTYQFGPSYARKLGENWSLGATLYAHYRDATFIRNELIELETGDFEWSNLYSNQTEWGAKPKIGLMGGWGPLGVGMAVSRVFVLSAENKTQPTYTYQGSTASQTVLPFPVEDEEKGEYPWVISFGLAWFPSSSLILSAEGNYYTEVEDEGREAIFNFAFGGEYYLNPSWALRAGVFSDRANTPEVVAGGANQAEHVDLYGGALSLTRFTRSSSITLGVNYATGDGDAQLIDRSQKIQELEMQNLSVFLSAAYSY